MAKHLGKAAAPKVGPPPAELQGTYTVRLLPSDLPAAKDAPPDFRPGTHPFHWVVKISDRGGPGNAPSFTIFHPAAPRGALESSKLTVTGDRLKLTDEDCGAPGGHSLISTTYRWRLSGNTLRLTRVAGGCPDKEALTILTAHPLLRAG